MTQQMFRSSSDQHSDADSHILSVAERGIDPAPVPADVSTSVPASVSAYAPATATTQATATTLVPASPQPPASFPAFFQDFSPANTPDDSSSRHARHAARAAHAAHASGSSSSRGGAPRRSASASSTSDSAREWLLWCGIPVLIVLLMRVFLFGFYVIPSGSMLDTIEINDRVITTKLAPDLIKLQRGDIVVFKDPANWLQSESSMGSDDLIKRLIGLPGDTVACAGAGQPVTINGVAIDESAYLKPGVQPSDFAFNVTVTEGHIFVLGDNRANSADSRYHQNDGSNGLVPISDVLGVAIVRNWPLNRIGRLDSHHEVFANVPNPA